MITLIENQFPWFGEMTDMGGDILLMIVVLAAIMWCLLLERLIFFSTTHPRQVQRAKKLWSSRDERFSWYAHQFRARIIFIIGRDLQKNIGLIKTLVKLCPLLGLLGTVLGMLEVFDALAVTGSSNPRSTAAGVSKAIITTMAGMVVAISGLPLVTWLSKKSSESRNALHDALPTQTSAEAQPVLKRQGSES